MLRKKYPEGKIKAAYAYQEYLIAQGRHINNLNGFLIYSLSKNIYFKMSGNTKKVIISEPDINLISKEKTKQDWQIPNHPANIKNNGNDNNNLPAFINNIKNIIYQIKIKIKNIGR